MPPLRRALAAAAPALALVLLAATPPEARASAIGFRADPYGYDPRAPSPSDPPPPAVQHTPAPVLVSVGAAFLPTGFCGRLRPGENCFLGVMTDFAVKIAEAPRAFSLMLDFAGIAYRDFREVGWLGGAGLRLRVDRIGFLVPYGVVAVYAGMGHELGAGNTVRVATRFAAGLELSLRNGRGGRGAGLFVEAGSGAGCCTMVSELRDAYTQFFLLAGISFP